MIIATQTESKLYSYSRLYVGNSRTEVIYLGYPLELTKKVKRKAKKIGKRKIIHNRSKIGYFLNEEM